jgi:hypothetical protein
LYDINARLDNSINDLNMTFETGNSTLYLHSGENLDTSVEGNNVIASTVITGTGGGGTSGAFKLVLNKLDENSNLITLKGEQTYINYETILSTVEDNEIIPGAEVGIYLYVNDELKTTYTEKTGQHSLEITEYLSDTLNNNNIKLVASYNNYIESTDTIIPLTSIKYWNVETIDLYITSTFEDGKIYDYNLDSLEFDYIPYGNLNKTIYFSIDDKEPDKEENILTSG